MDQQPILLVSAGPLLYPKSRNDYASLLTVNFPLTIIPQTSLDALSKVMLHNHGREVVIESFDSIARELKEATLFHLGQDPVLSSRVIVHPETSADSPEMKFLIRDIKGESFNALISALDSDDFDDVLTPQQSVEQIATSFENSIVNNLNLHLGKYQHRVALRKVIREDGSILYGISFAQDLELNNVRFFSPNGLASSEACMVNFSPSYRIRFEMTSISVTEIPEPALRLQVEEHHGNSWEANGVPRTFMLKHMDKASVNKLALFLLSLT